MCFCLLSPGPLTERPQAFYGNAAFGQQSQFYSDRKNLRVRLGSALDFDERFFVTH